MTDAGLLFAQHAQRILDEIQEAELAVSKQQQALRGTFRINLPMSFSMSHLLPLIAEFLSHHTALPFQIELADRYVDVIGEGLNMAIHIGTLADSTLIARPLGELKRVICCTPLTTCSGPARRSSPTPYCNTPVCAMDGKGRMAGNCRLMAKRNGWRFRAPMVSNNDDVLRDAALAGLGLVLLSAFIGESALQRGERVTVLDGCQPPPLSLNAVYPQHRQRSEINRQLLAFLQTRLAP